MAETPVSSTKKTLLSIMFKLPKAFLCVLLAACATCVVGLDFSGANWIWTPGRSPNSAGYPSGNVTFRRDFTPPSGRVPISADILITADDAYTLYVNGRRVGTAKSLQVAQRYCVPLVKDCNVFAVSANNVIPSNNPAGLLAAIQIRYSDGFIETVVSDTKWHAVTGTPAGFEQVAFDDSKWPAAFSQGPYPTTAPWANTVAIPPENQNPGPSLQSGNWVWTNEVSDPSTSAPVGPRAFRKTAVLPNGQLTSQARILIATDNEHTVYVNGLLVGSGQSFQEAQRYVVNFPPTSKVVIAVYAVNTGGPAGLLVSAELVSCICSDDSYFVTDGSWKYSTSIPAGFIASDFNDSAWPNAKVEGKVGIAPWGSGIKVPAGNTPQSAALPGAPAAQPASVVA